MHHTKKIYESTFIVNASLDDHQIDGVIEKVKDVIVKNNGEIREMVKWGRKRFTYPIKKKNNGFYVIAEFSAPGDVVAKLERHYFLDESILRYLTIMLDKKALQGRPAPSLLASDQPSTEAKPAEPVKSASAEGTVAKIDNSGVA
jgi:small subunit ribosomal protein S6